MFPFILSLLSFILVLGLAVEVWRGFRCLTRLENVSPMATGLPRVSIIFAARNEQEAIAEATRSHLAQDYPDFEVIAVDDRSTDHTPQLLAQLSQETACLRVLRVNELPPGWLGKCNALRRGAEVASGDWLLFTDADVVLETSVLRRAITLALQTQLDHLTIAPYAHMPGPLLQTFTAAFGLFFSMFVRPWRMSDPHTTAYAGIGAFNLVKAEVYRTLGGHERVRLSPDDDMRLGKVLKQSGARQGFALGQQLIHVEWYSSLPALIRGLDKGVFAGLDYAVLKTVLSTIVPLLLFLWPVLGLLFGGWTTLICAGTCVLFTVLYLDQARLHRLSAATAILFPVCCLLFVWILWSSTIKTLVRGGIAWRGTFYPLKELRRGLV